ncbi:MAG: ABC transporter ATP-binding protein [Acidobacteria bacterium]|nr:ABC transporter ATP-binding protein [Acidobacteriota bacterium]
MDLWLEQLTKYFDGKLAVEIPALTIGDGEYFTFVGPSGCGKSTTLNLIAGLEEPTTGTLRLGDRLLNALPPHQRDVAFVFQSYALYPHRTVFQNLAFPLELARLPRETIRRRVLETASLLGLTSLLEKRPRQLSGGERQRVALGRAIVREPQLFLFDEPLSNLDAPLRVQMRKELKRLHRQLGTTFIYVTHDQEEALSLSDRIAVMQAGKIQQCGSPREVYDRPNNLFVASFFGTPPMNFLPAELEIAGQLPCVRLAHLRLPLQGIGTAATKPGPVTLGVRPENLHLSTGPAAEGLPAKITVVEPHGGQVFLELETLEDGIRLTVVEGASTTCKAGDPVWVTFANEKLYYFDVKTGMRLAS